MPPDGPGHPYVPNDALLGGDGIVQGGQSEVIGRDPATGGFLRSVTLLNAECFTMYGAMVTVVLTASRDLPAAAAGAENEGLPMFALVSFGNGGTQSTQQLEVDYINGMMFNLPAGFLRVDAVLEPEVQESEIGMNAGAFIGYYPIGRTRNAQRTRLLGAIANGASSAVRAIPFFATRVELIGTDPLATYLVEQFADTAGAILLAAVNVPASTQVAVPLVNSARYFRVTNTGASPSTVRALFHLTV